MPRPVKCRKVCHFPQTREFCPTQGCNGKSPVILTVDEYETIRLIDKEGMSQVQCSEFMQVARTTVQRVYESARKKLADALVDGRYLRIEGGDFWLCEGKNRECGRCRRNGTKNIPAEGKKEVTGLKIAIPLDENKQDVCMVLARAPLFLFRENGEDIIVENPAAQANSAAGVQAAQFLVDSKIGVLITPRCGQNAAEVFNAADIKIYKSANKAAADDLKAWEQGTLEELTHFHGGYHGIQ